MRSITADSTLDIADRVVRVDATGGNIALTLCDAKFARGTVVIDRIDASANTVTVTASAGGSIYDRSSFTLPTGIARYVVVPDSGIDGTQNQWAIAGFSAVLTTAGTLNAVIRSVSTGITAGTTQTQAGATLLVAEHNYIATCANANDGVRLPSAVAGLEICVWNDGAQTAKVYPFLGDDVGGGANVATTIASGAGKIFRSKDGTTWKATAL